MKDITIRLKRLYGKGEFGPEFLKAVDEDFPQLFGRISLLEEFYYLNAPGNDDRSRNLHTQLGEPLRFHGNPLRRLLAAITG